MKTVKTGLFSKKYFFSLAEYDKYIKCKKKNKGFYDEIFINNSYCLEVTKRTIKLQYGGFKNVY